MTAGAALAPLAVCCRGHLLVVDAEDFFVEVGFGLARQSRARFPCLPQLWHFRDSFLGLIALFGRCLVLELVLTERDLWLLIVLRRGYVLRVNALFLTPLGNLAREAEADLPMCDVVRARRNV